MLTGQFLACFDFVSLMHGVRGGNQARRIMKNENWLQKLIYRISDNKFNSFSSLFRFSGTLLRLPPCCSLIYPLHSVSSEILRKTAQHKNYQISLLLFTYELYTPSISPWPYHSSEVLEVFMQLPHIIDDRNCSYVNGSLSFQLFLSLSCSAFKSLFCALILYATYCCGSESKVSRKLKWKRPVQLNV